MGLVLLKKELEVENFQEVKEKFEQQGSWGLHTGIDVHNCDSDLIRDAGKIKEFVKLLCERIKMRRFGETVVVNFGEDERVAGYSMTQLIETSLISGHFANQSNNVYLDVFSCKLYNPWEVADFTKEFFKGEDHQINISHRK